MPPGGQQVVVMYGIGPDGRSLIPISVDAAGALSVAGGGIAAAVSIADGLDVAEGATTSAESTSGNGTVIGILKNIRTRLVAIIAQLPAALTGTGNFKVSLSEAPLTGTGALGIQGQIAHDTGIGGNPVRVGARTTTSGITAVSDADTVDVIADKYGRAINSPYAPVDVWTSGHPAVVIDNSAHDILAAAGVGLKWYLCSLSVINSHATVDTLVTIQDDSAVVLWRVWARHDGGGEAIKIEPPIPTTANGKLQVICGTTGASVYVDASAFKAA